MHQTINFSILLIVIYITNGNTFQITPKTMAGFRSLKMSESYGNERIQLITDIDDTVKSSGGVRLFWKVARACCMTCKIKFCISSYNGRSEICFSQTLLCITVLKHGRLAQLSVALTHNMPEVIFTRESSSSQLRSAKHYHRLAFSFPPHCPRLFYR